MKVRELQNLKDVEFELIMFMDCKGNYIPTDIVKSRFMDWEIESAPNIIDIKIKPNENAARSFFADLKGTINAKGIKDCLFTLDSLTSLTNMTMPTIRAWMWGLAYYGLSQREWPYGYNSDQPMWVIE